MKQCRDRNCDMLENCSISGKHPFEVDFKQRVDIAVNIPTGEKTSFLGIPYEKSNRYRANGIPPFGHRTRLCEQHQKPLCRRLFHFIRSGAAHITPLRRSFLIIQRR